MTKPKPKYQIATDALDRYTTRTPPTFWPVGEGDLARVTIGPGLITLLGGPPGCGKTSLCVQLVTDALRLTPSLRALIANVEMPSATLIEKQMSRLSGIDAETLRYCRVDDSHSERIAIADATLRGISDRLCFLDPPFDLQNIASAADDFEARLICIDYAQRFTVPGQHDGPRSVMNTLMGYLRQFAANGCAILVVSRVSRGRDKKGASSYTDMNIASFSESSELEYGADDAFILSEDKKRPGGMTLQYLKSRFGNRQDIELTYDFARCNFTPRMQ